MQGDLWQKEVVHSFIMKILKTVAADEDQEREEEEKMSDASEEEMNHKDDEEMNPEDEEDDSKVEESISGEELENELGCPVCYEICRPPR